MRFWRRLLCRFTDHEMVALMKWSPEAICISFLCNKCHKELGHMDLPLPKSSTTKEKMH